MRAKDKLLVLNRQDETKWGVYEPAGKIKIESTPH